MSYQITSRKDRGGSMFYVGVETGALYVKVGLASMLCIDGNGSAQVEGRNYSANAGRYEQVKPGQTIIIKVGE